jgi:hypothetical protein
VTHAILIQNTELVTYLQDDVLKKTATGLDSKKINFMKDEGYQENCDKFNKLL